MIPSRWLAPWVKGFQKLPKNSDKTDTIGTTDTTDTLLMSRRLAEAHHEIKRGESSRSAWIRPFKLHGGGKDLRLQDSHASFRARLFRGRRYPMKMRKWVCACATVMIALSTLVAFADQHGHGHGHGRGQEKKEQKHYYSDHDRAQWHEWYRKHSNNLPPGLAKRDRLPPGLERKLRVRAPLPPDLRSDIHPCPEELVRQLPPPPPDAEHVLLGGHIVLMNRKTFVVLEIIHLEL
jgi:hypothetical protein